MRGVSMSHWEMSMWNEDFCCSHLRKFNLPYFGSPLACAFVSLALISSQLPASQIALFHPEGPSIWSYSACRFPLAPKFTSFQHWCYLVFPDLHLHLLLLTIPPPSSLALSKTYRDTAADNTGHIALKILHLY